MPTAFLGTGEEQLSSALVLVWVAQLCHFAVVEVTPCFTEVLCSG